MFLVAEKVRKWLEKVFLAALGGIWSTKNRSDFRAAFGSTLYKGLSRSQRERRAFLNHFLRFWREDSSATVCSLFPVAFVGLALCLTVILGVFPLIGVVRVLGSAGHARGLLFCWILSDFHCTTSLCYIIAHYKIKIKINMVG